MSKYINLEKQLIRLYRLGLSSEEDIKQFLLTACTEDVEKVRHGKWVELPPFKGIYTCSLCGRWGEYHWNYCPNCGAKMDK